MNKQHPSWQDHLPHTTTTDKINRSLSEAEQRVLRQVAEVWSQVMDDRQKISEHENFIDRLKRNLFSIVKK